MLDDQAFTSGHLWEVKGAFSPATAIRQCRTDFALVSDPSRVVDAAGKCRHSRGVVYRDWNLRIDYGHRGRRLIGERPFERAKEYGEACERCKNGCAAA